MQANFKTLSPALLGFRHPLRASAPAITAANVPSFVATPAAADRIDIGAGNVINLPN
jgi:hypothetical protein